MKKIGIILMAMIFMITSAGCAVVVFDTSYEKGIDRGNMVTKDYPCGDFDKLIVSVQAYLEYTAEKSDKVRIVLPEGFIEYVTVENNDGTLMIRYNSPLVSKDFLPKDFIPKDFIPKDVSGIPIENNDSKFMDAPVVVNNLLGIPRIYVSAPTLKKLELTNNVICDKFDKIVGDSFDLKVSGSKASGSFSVEVDKLNIYMDSEKDIFLSGTANTAALETSLYGNIRGFDLRVKEASAISNYPGNIEISCSDKLNVNTTDVGCIYYKGNPVVSEISPTKAGKSNVEKVSD